MLLPAEHQSEGSFACDDSNKTKLALLQSFKGFADCCSDAGCCYEGWQVCGVVQAAW